MKSWILSHLLWVGVGLTALAFVLWGALLAYLWGHAGSAAEHVGLAADLAQITGLILAALLGLLAFLQFHHALWRPLLSLELEGPPTSATAPTEQWVMIGVRIRNAGRSTVGWGFSIDWLTPPPGAEIVISARLPAGRTDVMWRVGTDWLHTTSVRLADGTLRASGESRGNLAVYDYEGQFVGFVAMTWESSRRRQAADNWTLVCRVRGDGVAEVPERAYRFNAADMSLIRVDEA